MTTGSAASWNMAKNPGGGGGGRGGGGGEITWMLSGIFGSPSSEVLFMAPVQESQKKNPKFIFLLRVSNVYFEESREKRSRLPQPRKNHWNIFCFIHLFFFKVKRPKMATRHPRTLRNGNSCWKNPCKNRQYAVNMQMSQRFTAASVGFFLSFLSRRFKPKFGS